MKNLLLIGFVLLAFASCKKDSDSASTNNTNDSLSTKTYVPVTTGSYWKYGRKKDSSGVVTTDTFTLTVQKNLQTIGSFAYSVLSDTTKPSVYTFYYRSSGDTSYRKGVLPSISSALPDFEEKYFVNAKLNSIWKDTIQISGFDAYRTYQVLDTSSSLTLSGTTYNHVSKVHLDISNPFAGTLGSGDFYYARGLNTIGYTLKMTIPTLSDSVYLIKAVIK